MESKYYTHVQPRLKEVSELVREGKTEREIAAELGVSYTTFREHKIKYPELATVLSSSCVSQVGAQGETERNAAVEEALYKAATGYTIKVVKPITIKHTETTTDKAGNKVYKSWETVEMVEVTEHIPANVKAIEYYTINKIGSKYKLNPHQTKLNNKKFNLAVKKDKRQDW